jgi:hypothetical protein
MKTTLLSSEHSHLFLERSIVTPFRWIKGIKLRAASQRRSSDRIKLVPAEASLSFGISRTTWTGQIPTTTKLPLVYQNPKKDESTRELSGCFMALTSKAICQKTQRGPQQHRISSGTNSVSKEKKRNFTTRQEGHS